MLLLNAARLPTAAAGATPMLRGASQETALGCVNGSRGPWGFDLSGRDLGVAPGNDFFSYAGGRYLTELKIPEDQSGWGEFSILADKVSGQVHTLLEGDLARGGKAGRLFGSYMDEALIEDRGLAPVQPLLAQVAEVDDGSSFASLAGRSSHGFLPSPFGLWISADPHDPDSYTVMVDQGGLGLPDRDYYLKKEFALVKIAYAKHIATMLEMIGWPDALRASVDVLALEENIAEHSWSSVEMRDPVKTYNPRLAAELQSEAPGFNWTVFLEQAGPIPEDAKLVVGALSAVTSIARILGEAEIAVLRSWAAFHLISSTSSYLPNCFVNARFKFHQVLSGQLQMRPRWKRAVGTVNSLMGEAVGAEYVQEHFPPSSKTKMLGLVGRLQHALASRIGKLDWMTNATKEKALEKLAAISFFIGYPDKFRDYTDLTIDEADLFGNVERAHAFHWRFRLSQLGQPVDRNEWHMSPQTVNAYYSPTSNSVVFPAAILQPPFFDPDADMAVNFGGIGMVIGHEMTHGFDDSGRRYGPRGKLHDWWTQADAREFDARVARYGEQFAAFTIGLPQGFHINPALTAGENIADLGGLTLALDAYHSWLRDEPKTSTCSLSLLQTREDPHEGDRRLFLGMSQVWRQKIREKALIQRLTRDPHSPGVARVDIPMRNLDAWYAAFNVSAGDALFLPKAERVMIW